MRNSALRIIVTNSRGVKSSLIRMTLCNFGRSTLVLVLVLGLMTVSFIPPPGYGGLGFLPARSARGLLTILQDLYLLQGDQAARHHAIQDGQECIDVVLAVDDLDQQRQVFREPQDFGRVEAARLAEAHGAAQHGGAGQMPLAR